MKGFFVFLIFGILLLGSVSVTQARGVIYVGPRAGYYYPGYAPYGAYPRRFYPSRYVYRSYYPGYYGYPYGYYPYGAGPIYYGSPFIYYNSPGLNIRIGP